jgi:hypothetical protein
MFLNLEYRLLWEAQIEVGEAIRMKADQSVGMHRNWIFLHASMAWF